MLKRNFSYNDKATCATSILSNEITEKPSRMTTQNLQDTSKTVKEKLNGLFDEIIEHDGFGEIRVEVNILKRKQKEVILHCGKQYRFVVDVPQQ